jgi:hypothetical protein
MRVLVGLVVLAGACHNPMFDPAKEDTAVTTVKKLAASAFSEWGRAHPDKPCPDGIEELVQYAGGKVAKDPWGHPYRMYCGEGLPSGVEGKLAVASDGPDGKPGTDDDVRSW